MREDGQNGFPGESQSSTGALLALLFAFTLAVRLTFWNADPVTMDFSISAYGDPGYYAANSRSAALFGVWSETEWFTLPVMPAWVVPLAAWFKVWGASYLTLRFFCIACHLLGAVATIMGVRRIWGDRVALWTGLLWATDWVSIAASRNGWIENILVAYLGLGFLVASRWRSLASALALGIFLGLAVAAKPYTLFIAAGGLIGFAWAHGKNFRSSLTAAGGFAVMVGAYFAGLTLARRAFPAAMENTFDGIIVDRARTDLPYLTGQLLHFQEIFATTFFSRLAPVFFLAVVGAVLLASRPSTRKTGEWTLLGMLGGLIVFYVYIKHRSVRYYLITLPVLYPLAGIALASLRASSPPTTTFPTRRGKAVLFVGSLALANAAVWTIARSLFDWKLSVGLWHLIAWPLAAILFAVIPPALRRFRALPYPLLVIVLIALPAAQFGSWIRHPTSQLHDVSAALATVHPPARVGGWLAPVLALGTPHRALWVFGKETDHPERYRELYGAEYWWTLARHVDPSREQDLIASHPLELFGRGQSVFVYRLGPLASDSAANEGLPSMTDDQREHHDRVSDIGAAPDNHAR